MRAERWLMVGGVAAAVNTLNAYRPLARRGVGGALAMFAAWPTAEEPVLTVGTQVAAVAGLVGAGGLRSRAGRAGLALAAASWAGIAGLAAKAATSDAVLDQALRAALGPRYLDELPADARRDVPLTRLQRSLPGVGPRRQFRAARHVSYGDAGRRNRMDIWRAADQPTDAKAPVLVHVHGGGWIIGNEEIQGELLLGEMARRGWVGVSITYRLSPKATWPDHIVDVKRALAWVKANIAQHGGDPDFVAITGGSAGGHLCALAALTAGDPAFQPGFEAADTSVRAAVPFYGVYDVGDLGATGNRDIAEVWEKYVLKQRVGPDRRIWEQASPLYRVRADAPPMFVLHGSNDTLVPVEQARRFVAALRAVSTQPVAYAELPGAQHAFEVFRSVRGMHAIHAVARFLSVIHARRPATPSVAEQQTAT